ncbi:MerR family transcriptional regulator [Evansella cellulosilytica]|uniref:Transcriptional regulator, MerR family n=1 Tax=Evansella cellulosilytica (strain ATCC 21833 / DSM 2522 / FERM P-1141 / JCM 9156 / N-4) TaxID=649639 RepID=E6U1D7_EVAC2|nr:MerR family transcriptional regulator [Evansella cellulosilytica]ADU29184.1 transcriptional regulator, MerR family [Evansella cellulosilytica DSM 2522]
MISIKEVAKQTGVTVRTLRHYDHIGLLKPLGKTEGGHRLYGEDEMKKLQGIQFLKTLRFSLAEIKDLLDDNTHDWYMELQNQLNYCINEKQKLEQMESLIRGLMNEFTIEGKNDLSHIQQLIRMYEDNSHERERFRQERFTEKEHELLDLLPNINNGDPDTIEWVSLLAQIKKHMNKGVDSTEIQSIIRRMLEKEKETFGNDPQFSEKLWEVRSSQEESKKAGFYPIEQEVIEFVEEATNFYLKGDK